MAEVVKSPGHARPERADHQQVATSDAFRSSPSTPGIPGTQQQRAEDGQLFDDCSAGTWLLQLGIT